MLRSLEIRNYRNLRYLTIEKLGRVNLLVGKNNTGKTSVLEAMAIYASTFSEGVTIKSLLQRRGEFTSINSLRDSVKSDGTNALTAISSLFTDYTPSYFSSNYQKSDIYVGENSKESLRSLFIGIRQSYQILRKDESGREIIEYIIAEKEEDIGPREFRYELVFDRNHSILTRVSLAGDSVFKEALRRADGEPELFQYIDSRNQTQQPIDYLYGKIALTDNEEIIVDALKIIEPKIERFSLIEENRLIIRLAGNKIRNLSSMGDGVSRIFSIILSMVNCEKSYLLIDEFENGLHYSVQEKLWEVIFFLAGKLNIQVFATTHSNDTIKAFGEVANANGEYSDAQLIQLRNSKGEISAVLFNAQDVEIAMETDYLDLR
ncbi:AAA family ATPase [Spirosoma daeguense]